MSDALARLNHKLEAAQRVVADAEGHCVPRAAKYQSTIQDADNPRKQTEQAHEEWMSVLEAEEDLIFAHDKDFHAWRCIQAYRRPPRIPCKKVIGPCYLICRHPARFNSPLTCRSNA